MSNLITALYIHIPFCHNICTYCDFYKMIAKENLQEKYIEYLVKELKLKKKYYQDIKTIYIGGGTPSCIPINLLDYLLFHINKYIDFSKVLEFSIEANPNDVNENFVQILKKYHVNRVSLGVQSFNDEKLKILGRTHSIIDVKKAMKILTENNLTNINIDLIYGVNNEKFQSLKKDLQIAIKLKATHISAYSLILEEKTILKKLVDEGKFKTMDDDSEHDLYTKILGYLKGKKFIHYEISNFSRKNYQCKHNLVYWDNMNYIGVGASSSYYINNTRYTNINNLDSYFKGIDQGSLIFSEITKLTKTEQMGEELMLGLRKIKGVNLFDFKQKYQVDAYSVFPIIEKLINLKLLKLNGDFLFIPLKKLYLSNEVLVNFI